MSGKEATKKSTDWNLSKTKPDLCILEQIQSTNANEIRLVVFLKLHLTPNFLNMFYLALREDFLVKYIIITHTLYLHDGENFWYLVCMYIGSYFTCMLYLLILGGKFEIVQIVCLPLSKYESQERPKAWLYDDKDDNIRKKIWQHIYQMDAKCQT